MDPLTEAELGLLLPGRPGDVIHAIWLASGGRPEVALEVAADIADGEGGGGGGDAVARLALRVSSRAEFLVPDVALLRLLESAAARRLPSGVRARVLIRWARELLSDPSAADRRRDLAAEAVRLARESGDAGTLGEVLDGQLHALWDPLAAPQRLGTAAEIIELARLAGDATLELRGLFWRFTALVELGELDAAEAALVVYARTGELAGDAHAGIVTLSRQAVLAIVRGRLDLAATLTDQVAVAGRRAGLADTARLTASLAGRLAVLRGAADAQVAPLLEMARRLPGHFYEATAARVMADAGRDAEALLELDRVLPAVLAGSGPRWLGAVADLAFVASRGGDPGAVQKLYDVLVPYQGRLVVWGGANMVTGPVDDLLGRLAGRLGRAGEARAHLDRAVAQEERLGALPWLCATLAARGRPGDRERARSLAARLGLAVAPGDEWRLLRDGDDWFLEAGAETVRLRDVRGLHYLRTLVSSPGSEIAALDLVSGGAGLTAPPGEPVLDAGARNAYSARLVTLEEHLDEADRAGDAVRASEVAVERAALVAELRAATGLGGRPRLQSAEAERARVNATRALSTVLSRLEKVTPLAAGHLRASLRTGSHFRYQPAAGGPRRWRVSS
ncbi:hypothetical protein GCM10010435_77920 [Winogradskya consettensis]|uniref:Uncharacterized protein n=1 Tax=Winogradskya consettensis TaxID=113560 RepID=A0A919VT27_9ACTN|nr:hypothetical protein [Actinoplanes consettensis]GIM74802.1 hypothetical protein Aco04nite_42130 [Actinoplanes consettensis]